MLLKKRIKYSKKVAHLNQKLASKRVALVSSDDRNRKVAAVNELGTEQDCKLIIRIAVVPKSGANEKQQGGAKLHQSRDAAVAVASTTTTTTAAAAPVGAAINTAKTRTASSRMTKRHDHHRLGTSTSSSSSGCGRPAVSLPSFKFNSSSLAESGRKLFVNEARRNQIAENGANKLDRVAGAGASVAAGPDHGGHRPKLRQRKPKTTHKPDLDMMRMRHELTMIYVNDLIKEMKL